MDIRKAETWVKLWAESRTEKAGLTQDEAIAKSIDRWNKRADSFAKNVLGDTGNPRIQKMIAWMEAQGVEIDGADILDIGSGPGAFAIPMAERARRVIALEPAGEMANLLEAQVRERRIANIGIVREPWETLSLEGKHWTKMFDLVFASMSPGISDLDTLTKAIAASKRFVYISSYAGKKEYESLTELWPELFDKDYPAFHLDMIYSLNLIYTLGYDFTSKVWGQDKTREIPVAEALDFLFNQMKMQADDEILAKIEADPDYYEGQLEKYILERSTEGIFTHRSTARLGAMLIDLG